MDDKDAVRQFVLDFKPEVQVNLDEVKDICIGSDRFLETKMAVIKSLEAEIFSKTIQLSDMRQKLLHQIALKSKEAQVVIPSSDQSLRKYMMNKMFCFDAKQEKLEELEEFAADPAIQDKFKGQILTKLILRDLRSHSIEYLLVYSTSTLALNSVYSIGSESGEMVQCQIKEVQSLVEKLTAFIGETYFGTKGIVIQDLITYAKKNSYDEESKSDISMYA
jgi:hypothetical protein